jgi:flagellar hook-associated protein 2
VFDPENSVGPSMADDDNHPVIGQDAKARINGLAVTSKTNTLTGNIPGVTVNLLATTAAGSPLTMRISEDVTPASKNVTDFVTAYNTLSANLADLTKYDGSTKAAGLFQGDSSVVGLQNVLRRMLGSTSLGATSQRLADIGIEMLKDGSLTINTTKLSVAANNGSSLQQLFTANNGDPLTNGFALKFKALGQGMLGTDGAVGSKATSLQKALDSNTAAQTKVNDKATLFETRLRARYSALDAQMAQLNALNSYVSQQVTSWNKSTG